MWQKNSGSGSLAEAQGGQVQQETTNDAQEELGHTVTAILRAACKNHKA